MAPLAVKFVVQDVVAFTRPKKTRLLREQQPRKAGQKQLVLYDAMSHAGVEWRAARASAMVGGGRRSRRLAKSAGAY
jgi:ABC-type hemin transport system ATPase subunit